jgi:hypothetical protein
LIAAAIRDGRDNAEIGDRPDQHDDTLDVALARCHLLDHH